MSFGLNVGAFGEGFAGGAHVATELQDSQLREKELEQHQKRLDLETTLQNYQLEGLMDDKTRTDAGRYLESADNLNQLIVKRKQAGQDTSRLEQYENSLMNQGLTHAFSKHLPPGSTFSGVAMAADGQGAVPHVTTADGRPLALGANGQWVPPGDPSTGPGIIPNQHLHDTLNMVRAATSSHAHGLFAEHSAPAAQTAPVGQQIGTQLEDQAPAPPSTETAPTPDQYAPPAQIAAGPGGTPPPAADEQQAPQGFGVQPPPNTAPTSTASQQGPDDFSDLLKDPEVFHAVQPQYEAADERTARHRYQYLNRAKDPYQLYQELITDGVDPDIARATAFKTGELSADVRGTHAENVAKTQATGRKEDTLIRAQERLVEAGIKDPVTQIQRLQTMYPDADPVDIRDTVYDKGRLQQEGMRQKGEGERETQKEKAAADLQTQKDAASMDRQMARLGKVAGQYSQKDQGDILNMEADIRKRDSDAHGGKPTKSDDDVFAEAVSEIDRIKSHGMVNSPVSTPEGRARMNSARGQTGGVSISGAGIDPVSGGKAATPGSSTAAPAYSRAQVQQYATNHGMSEGDVMKMIQDKGGSVTP